MAGHSKNLDLAAYGLPNLCGVDTTWWADYGRPVGRTNCNKVEVLNNEGYEVGAYIFERERT